MIHLKFDHTRDLQIQKPLWVWRNGHISCSDSQSLCRWLCCGAVLRFFDGICKADALLCRVLHQGLRTSKLVTRCMTSCMKKKKKRSISDWFPEEIYTVYTHQEVISFNLPSGEAVFADGAPGRWCGTDLCESNSAAFRCSVQIGIGHGWALLIEEIRFTPCWCGKWSEYHLILFFKDR